MAPSTETFLVGLGLDPASVRSFLQSVDRARNTAEGAQIQLSVATNSGEVTSQISADLDRVDAQAQDFTDDFTEGLDEATEAAGELEKGLLAISAAAAVGLFASIKFAAEEGRNLAQANAILKLSAEELSDVQRELRQIATDTGLTFQNVSGALFDVASSGRRGADALDAIRAAALVAAPGGSEVVEVYSALDAIMKNFGVSASQAADSLVQTAEQSIATTAEVAQAIAQLGPLAKAFNIRFEEIAGTFATITAQQVDAARATTQTAALIRAFLKPAAELREEFAKVGLTIGDTAFRTQDLATKIEILRRASEEGTVELSRLFSDEALQAAALLTGNVEALQENISGIVSASGAARAAFAAFRSQAAVQLDAFVAAVTNAATAIGSDLLATVLPFLEFLEEFINENRELISVLGRVGIAFGALIAVVTTINFVIGQLSAVVTVATFAWTRYAASVGIAAIATAFFETVIAPLLPVLILVGAVLAIVAGTFLLFKDEIFAVGGALKGFVTQIGTALLPLLDALKNIFNDLLVPIGELVFSIGASLVEASALLLEVFGELAGLIGSVLLSRLKELVTVFARMVNGLALLVKGAVSFSVAILSTPLGLLQDGVDLFRKALRFLGVQLDDTTQKAERAKISPVERKVLEEDEAALKRFNRILEENTDVTEKSALRQALSAAERLKFLRQLKTQGEISSTQERELAQVTREVADAEEKGAISSERLAKARKNFAIANDILKRTQEEAAKVIKRTEAEIVAVRQGSDAAQLVQLRKAGLERARVLRENAVAQIGVIENLQRKIAFLGQDEAPDAKLLATLSAKLQANREQFANVSRAIADNFEIFNARIIQAGTVRIDKIEQQGQKEIDNARKVADEVIKQERRKVDAAEKELTRLQGIRDRELSQGRDFLEQLRDQETGRRDPALLALQRLEREATARLAGASVADATAALALLRNEVELLTNRTAEQIRVNEQLAQVRQRINEGRAAERDTTADVAREAELVAQLATLEALRVERKTAAVEVQERLGELTATAQARETELAAQIATEEEKIRDAKEAISVINIRLESEEQRITDQIKAQVVAQREFVRLQQLSLQASKELTAALLVGDSPARTELQTSALATVTDLANEAARRSTETSRAVNQAVQEGRVVLQKQTSEFGTFIASIQARQELESQRSSAASAAVTQFQTASERIAASAEITTAAVSASATNVEDIGNAQEEFGQAVEGGFAAVNTKLSEIGAKFEQQAGTIRSLERQIANQSFDTSGADDAASGF